MPNMMSRGLARLRRWLRSKSFSPAALASRSWLLDVRSRRHPASFELLGELKNTVFTCASINAAVCAAFPPRLYVATDDSQPEPLCRSRRISGVAEKRLRERPGVPVRHKRAGQLAEVLDHPLLTLLSQVNPVHSAFDLWELTTFYQEVVGSAYWLLEPGPFGVPAAIWPLPAQHVMPRRQSDSKQIVDYYEFRNGVNDTCFTPDQIIHFRYPDPKDPYTAGLSPLRACWEQAALTSDYLAFKRATWQNSALPGVVLSLGDMVGEEERDRLEKQWSDKFQHGGAGKALVADSNMKVTVLTHSMGDLAALAEYGKTKEDVANAFHVPLSFLTSETNLANLQAAEHQHMAKAIRPRLVRRDEKLNQQLVPLFDPSGRLFLAADDPVPANQELASKQQDLDLKYGLLSINEVRQERGLLPVPWGDLPWLPVAWAPTDFPDRTAFAPGTGRAKQPRN
jgi:HK97 family phage portal protein